MIVEISIVPIGIGESLSRHVAEAVKVLKEKCKDYKLTPMGTIVEIESFKELGEILDEIVEKFVEMNVPRIYTVIKSDFRVKKTTMEYKVERVEMILESNFKSEKR
ncbi:thiamine-binding protein [Archaeoglobales archaeon]|nr:MAG: thiamine-binding protein [Archaeoglobales archaeon]